MLLNFAVNLDFDWTSILIYVVRDVLRQIRLAQWLFW